MGKAGEAMNKIIWTTTRSFKQSIKKAYLDYYGVNISDECVRRILRYHKELLKSNDKKFIWL